MIWSLWRIERLALSGAHLLPYMLDAACSAHSRSDFCYLILYFFLLQSKVHVRIVFAYIRAHRTFSEHQSVCVQCLTCSCMVDPVRGPSWPEPGPAGGRGWSHPSGCAAIIIINLESPPTLTDESKLMKRKHMSWERCASTLVWKMFAGKWTVPSLQKIWTCGKKKKKKRNKKGAVISVPFTGVGDSWSERVFSGFSSLSLPGVGPTGARIFLPQEMTDAISFAEEYRLVTKTQGR